MAIHAQWMVSDIAPLPFMTLFCLNFLGQFHAHPGVGTERKHLAWQLGGKGCLAVKLDIQMLPWLRSLDWCSPGVWEVIKNRTVVCQDTGCPSHPKNFCPILVTAPTPGLLPRQNKNNCRDACPLWAPVNELGTKRPRSNVSPEPSGLLWGSVPIPRGYHHCCPAAKSSQKYLILMSQLSGSINQHFY